MPSTALQRKDWIIAVLAAAKGESLSPVQLQKFLFLLGKRFPEVAQHDYYHFIPYSYGPFDAAIYSDAEQLEGEGYLIIILSVEGRYRTYSLTSAGANYAAGLPINANLRSGIQTIVDHVKSLSFQSLVSEIYREFPEMRENSVFKAY